MKRSNSQMTYSKGILLRTMGRHINVVDGICVKLNGRSWVVELKKDGNLELSICISTNDGRQKVRQRVMDMNTEVQKLKEDVHDLKRQQLLLLDNMEKVRDDTHTASRHPHV